MPLLNKLNAINHCRTCLIKINLEDNETKNICIRISDNCELQSFINKYTIEDRFLECLDKFPQHICLDCFKSIQEANRFLTQAKGSQEKLYALINGVAENSEVQTDLAELLIKDSLLETEIVALNNDEVIKADPFSENVVENNENAEDFDCSDDDSEWEASSASSSQNEISSKTGSTSKNKNEIDSNLTNDKALKDTAPKKKRRSKQEMEEYRGQQREKTENNRSKIKRRPKGTKIKFTCEQCGHRFAHQFTLEVHIRKVHEGNSRPYLCKHCPKTYVSMTGLTSHQQVEHSTTKRTFTCDFQDCNRIYSCLMGLQNHKRIKHSDPSVLNKFICEKCGATFCKRSLLFYHRRAKHPTEAEKAQQTEVYQCDVCQRTLASKNSLKYHKIKYHTGEMKYKCDVCGQKLAQKVSVEYHRLLHSTEKVPCKDCGKQFVREYDLKKHIRVVHLKLKPYKCSYCPETFASNKTMKHHQYTHTGEKPYVCNFPGCNKSYRQPTCLKNHLKTHEKSTEFSK